MADEMVIIKFVSGRECSYPITKAKDLERKKLAKIIDYPERVEVVEKKTEIKTGKKKVKSRLKKNKFSK